MRVKSCFKFFATLAWIIAASFGASPAAAQVVLIPHGGGGNDFQTYLIAFVSFVLLCFAAWRFFRRRG